MVLVQSYKWMSEWSLFFLNETETKRHETFSCLSHLFQSTLRLKPQFLRISQGWFPILVRSLGCHLSQHCESFHTSQNSWMELFHSFWIFYGDVFGLEFAVFTKYAFPNVTVSCDSIKREIVCIFLSYLYTTKLKYFQIILK